jgi:hypothetical protein
MIHVPADDQKELLRLANDLIEQCRVSVGARAAYCRLMNAIAETGRYDGTKSLVNLLYKLLDRTAAHLFSPVELKFNLDFERRYPKKIYEQGKVVAQTVTRQWERNGTDVRFGRGVFESLKYGACIHKQWVQSEGTDDHAAYYDKLVMPWQFGVYNESENNINLQPALCETSSITLPQVWRRISHLPNAKKLFERIRSHAMSGTAVSDPQSFFHQVLSTSQLNTGVQGATRPLPGGIVQLNNDPNYSIMGPQVAAPMVTIHELWVQDDADYTTIIMIDPDIIVAPLFKKENLLVKGSQLQPYRLIQPNEVTNWFWGRSELVDVIEPQGLLSSWLDDLRRLTGLQVDKFLAFMGETGMTDELYAQFRGAGYVNLGQGGKVEDLTPKIPPELIGNIKWLIETINQQAGFPPIMQGMGEPGVRAGSHANTLMKTASPTLRDRALLVERQCAIDADLTLSIREAKDPDFWWIMGDDSGQAEESKFLISELPNDWRVTVDSHSSSPIFQDENTQLVFAARKMNVVDDDYVIENTALPNKDAAHLSVRERKKAQKEFTEKLLQEHPEVGEKVALKALTGGKH